MTRKFILVLAAATAVAVAAAGCGKKADPKAPLRPVPAPLADFSAEREGARVTLRFSVPKSNADGSTPVAIDRVELYAVTLPDVAKPPLVGDVTVQANLVATLTVRAAAPDAPAADTDPKTPVAGEIVQHVETVKVLPDAAASIARAYVAVPAIGRRRSSASPMLVVPLSGSSVTGPPPVKITYSEDLVTLSWDAGAAGTRFIAERSAAGGAPPVRLTPQPTDQTSLALPIELGREICVTLRTVTVTGAVALVSEPSAVACETPIDKFPPAPPSGLVGTAADGAIELVWRPSITRDAAGYIVLRAEGAGGTLQRLTPVPVSSTTYRDASVRAGVTYEYVVVAVDTAKPPNESTPSNREAVTARDAGAEGRPGHEPRRVK